MFVHEPGLGQLWAAVGDPAESWTLPHESMAHEQMNRVMEQLERHEMEIVGDPLTLD